MEQEIKLKQEESVKEMYEKTGIHYCGGEIELLTNKHYQIYFCVYCGAYFIEEKTH